jgi:hypothetical protein
MPNVHLVITIDSYITTIVSSLVQLVCMVINKTESVNHVILMQLIIVLPVFNTVTLIYLSVMSNVLNVTIHYIWPPIELVLKLVVISTITLTLQSKPVNLVNLHVTLVLTLLLVLLV